MEVIDVDKILDGVDGTQKQTFLRAINQHIADKKAAEALASKQAEKYTDVTRKREARIAAKEAERASKEEESRLKCPTQSESSELRKMKKLLKKYGYKY